MTCEIWSGIGSEPCGKPSVTKLSDAGGAGPTRVCAEDYEKITGKPWDGYLAVDLDRALRRYLCSEGVARLSWASEVTEIVLRMRGQR